MDPGPPRLQRRDAEVFDSDGAVKPVIASISFPSLCFAAVDIAIRILAVRHSVVGRVLQIHNRVHRDYDSLNKFPI